MFKFANLENEFGQKVLFQLGALRRPVGQVHNLLQNTLTNPSGNGYMSINDKPVLATFRDPITHSNFGVPPNFTSLDLATKLRQIRNKFRSTVTNPYQDQIKQRMLA